MDIKHKTSCLYGIFITQLIEEVKEKAEAEYHEQIDTLTTQLIEKDLKIADQQTTINFLQFKVTTLKNKIRKNIFYYIRPRHLLTILITIIVCIAVLYGKGLI